MSAANGPANGPANGSANGSARPPVNEISKANRNARIFHDLYKENHEMIRVLTERKGEMNDILYSLNESYMKEFQRAGLKQTSAQSALEESSTNNEDTNEDTNEEEPLSKKNLEWKRRVRTKSHLRLPLHPAHRPKMASPSLTFKYFESLTIFLTSVKKLKSRYKNALKASTEVEESLNEYRKNPALFPNGFLTEKTHIYNNIFKHIHVSERMYVQIKDIYPRWMYTIATTPPLPPVMIYKNRSEEAKASRMATRKASRFSLREGKQALREKRGLPLSTSLKKRNQNDEEEDIQNAAQRVHRNLKSVRVRFGKGNRVRLINTREELREMERERLMEEDASAAASSSLGGSLRTRTLRKKRTRRSRA